MYSVLLMLVGLVILLGALYAYRRTRDAFHPAIVVAPPLLFMYSAWPLYLNRNDDLTWLLGAEGLVYAGTLYFTAVLAFYIGLLRLPGPRMLSYIRAQGRGAAQSLFAISLTPQVRRRIFLLGIGFGVIALLAYVTMIANVGGFVDAYSRAKGGGRAGSGYIGEAILLAFPAILMLGIARQGRGRIRPRDAALALLFAAPHLIQGTLGGRRGPLFLVLTVLFFAWLIALGKPPKMRTVLVALLAIGLAVVVVQSQRQHLYLGSGGEFDASRVAQVLDTETLEHNDYVAGVAAVLTRKFYGDYHWGGRYFVTVFVRPIPRQIWPTKYEDMAWMYRVVEGGGDWSGFRDALGFSPPRGSAVGFIADIYQEFAWGALLVIFLFGWGLAALWKRHRLRGGVWTVVFIQAMILTIYIPTQSFSAFYHRFLFMAIITALVWRFWISGRRRRAGSGTAPVAAARSYPRQGR